MTNANKNKGSGGERELVKYLIKVFTSRNIWIKIVVILKVKRKYCFAISSFDLI